LVAYSFQSRFAEKIISGAKRQTIRSIGKRRHARPGETLQLYTGMRTRQCRKIGEAVCSRVNSIKIFFDPPRVVIDDWAPCELPDELEAFAQSDGFENWADMEAFWNDAHGLEPFAGVLIQWSKDADQA
jgi:hypothetical protein